MKRFILLCFILPFICLNAKAQQLPDADTAYKAQYAEYTKKQKANRTAGWFLAGAGAVVFAIGIAQPIPEYYIDNDPRKGLPPQKGSALRIGGGVLGLASLPFFMQAVKYRRKAALVIKQENASVFGQSKYTINYTALAFKTKF